MMISYDDAHRCRRRELRYNTLFILALALIALTADPLAKQMEDRSVALSLHQ